MERSTLRAIVDLLPRYAHTRRDGWTPASLMPGQISLPEYLLLRRVAIERVDEPIPYHELRANALDPYRTVDPFLDQLPRLVELGLLEQSRDDYVLALSGRDLLMRGERAANDYAARRIRLPSDDLTRLASTLHDVAERKRRAPEPTDKAHQERVSRLRRFDPRQTPPIQLEYALYALQRARDDAHIAAWRAAGFRGPTLELLSHLWAGNATTSADLVKLTHDRMQQGDVESLLDDLERDGLVTRWGGDVSISGSGRETRDQIERETDRVYFAPWPEIDVGWVRDRLDALTASLISHRPLA